MFNAKKETEKIISFIRNYYKDNNLKGAVIGISGGKDSAVAAALFTRALGKENVVGVTMPCHSKDEDRFDAKLISDYYGFELYNFDLTDTFDTFHNQIEKQFNVDKELLSNSDINLKPRLRMATLYYLSALFTNLKNGTYLVAGTSNKCELYVGYFTKGGDSVHDISVLADLTVDEVIKIGEVLNVPKKVLYKEPSDGLSNLTDEDKLGVKYEDITLCMNNDPKLDNSIRKRIERLHENNQHKFNIPTYRKSA